MIEDRDVTSCRGDEEMIVVLLLRLGKDRVRGGRRGGGLYKNFVNVVCLRSLSWNGMMVSIRE